MLLHLTWQTCYHGERMKSIDFGGHRSKVKVMKGVIDKCGMHRDATARLCVVIVDTNSLLISSTLVPMYQEDLLLYRIISNFSPNSCRSTWKTVKVYDFPQCANLTCVDDFSTQKRQSISQSPRACSLVLCHSLTSFLYITKQEGFSDGLLG